MKKMKKKTLTKEKSVSQGKTEGKELQELSHAAVPGYRSAFYIVFAVGTAYLALILFAI